LRQNLQQVAPNQEKPHTTPLHSLIYSIYISVTYTDRRVKREDVLAHVKRQTRHTEQ
jgi:hypothetical protein